ncbi:putative ubiquitin-like-specific protease 2A isoform X1 [Astyanax mexicanus]|nr:putative ubiquitin-like-specific protease 2A isoform X1 [Astyanax mexicanus]
MEKGKRTFEAPSLTENSLATLDDGQWLDDVVLDIQMRSIYNRLGPHRRRKSLIYPVFFYTKLQSCGCKAVISWTKHEDIFQKDYLLIVENVLGVHWRLLIVCFPGKHEVETIKMGRKWVQTKRPCILMLDSQFVNVKESMEVFQNIRSYLTEMWKSMGRKTRVFSPDTMPALKVHVPGQQGNTSECGIFVLMHAEYFLNDPPKQLINELDCTSWFTLNEAFSRRRQIRDEMRRSLKALSSEEIQGISTQAREGRSITEKNETAGRDENEVHIVEGCGKDGRNEGCIVEAEERREGREHDEERHLEGSGKDGEVANATDEQEQETEVQRGKTKGGEKYKVVKDTEKESVGKEREDASIDQGRDYPVLGRLAVPGTKRMYTITQEEIDRRIKAENMSNNMLRSLIRVRKEDLPEELREQRPKKAKTKMSIFSALSEGEATDLALGLGAMLGRHVDLDLSESVSKAEAEAAKNVLCMIHQRLRETLGEDSHFSLLTHTFGPQAVDTVISFLISLLKKT